ncbi:LAGLIDADG family homing endonuclease [Nanoarchaeota archaeon]
MKIDEDLISVHAYLCADGYVIKNPSTNKQKYYMMGLRNTNLTLLRDFQKKFEKVFCKKPYLVEGERCRIGSKEIYEILTKQFGSFYSKDWVMPKLNNKLSKIWLRSFFDCEGWIFCKSHQNRHIGLDSINEKGLDQIINSLNKLEIRTIKKINEKRKMYRIFIYGKENLIKFQKEIGFLHPEKMKKLEVTINDFVNYDWNVNSKNLKNIFLSKARLKKPCYIRIISKEKGNLEKIKNLLNKFYSIESILDKRVNGLGTIYYELNIYKKSEIQKLRDLGFLQNLFKSS